jgi:hypothetical protein
MSSGQNSKAKTRAELEGENVTDAEHASVLLPTPAPAVDRDQRRRPVARSSRAREPPRDAGCRRSPFHRAARRAAAPTTSPGVSERPLQILKPQRRDPARFPAHARSSASAISFTAPTEKDADNIASLRARTVSQFAPGAMSHGWRAGAMPPDRYSHKYTTRRMDLVTLPEGRVAARAPSPSPGRAARNSCHA